MTKRKSIISLNEIIDGGYEPLSKSEMHFFTFETFFSGSSIRFKNLKTIISYMLKEIVPLLLHIINRNICRKVNNGISSKYYKLKNETDLWKFLAINIILENLKNRSTFNSIEKNLQFIKNNYNMEIGIHKYNSMLSCFIPTNDDFDTIIKILNSKFKNCWKPNCIMCIDESIFEYEPSEKTKKRLSGEIKSNMIDPIPQMYFFFFYKLFFFFFFLKKII